VTAAALAIGGVLLIGMVVAAGYAVAVLPPDARVPLHAGSPEYSVWLSKRAGLTAWLTAGAAVFAILALLTRSGLAANWAASVRLALLPSVMCVALAAEAAAIITAQRRCAAQQPVSDPSGFGGDPDRVDPVPPAGLPDDVGHVIPDGPR
jgi:hypothetical protein